MDNQDWDGLDPARSRLLALSERMNSGFLDLGTGTGPGALASEKAALLETWRELSTALALEERPELRGCPHCQRQILAQATRCRYCMRHSDPRVTT